MRSTTPYRYTFVYTEKWEWDSIVSVWRKPESLLTMHYNFDVWKYSASNREKKELFPTVSLVALVFYCTAALYRNSQQILKAHGCSRCKQNTWYRNTQQYKLLDTMHTNIFRQTAESWTSMWNGKWFWMMLQAMTVHWLVRMMFLSFYFVYQTSRRIRKTVEKKTRKKREKNM